MRVLVIDEGFMSGAYAALGLHAHGCAVDVLAAVGGRARCLATGGEWQFVPRVGTSALAAVLDASTRNGGYDVVYPATEPLQQLLHATPPAFRDKRVMSALMKSAGIAVPAEHPAETDDDVRAAGHALGLPLVIKGSVGRGGNATFIVRSIAAAQRVARRMRARGGEVFAQEHIAGVTYLAGGVFDDGRAIRLYCGAKRVQFPARTGPAAELESSSDPALVETALRVFAAARVTGLASADFLRAADGRYYFVELNPRPWGSITAARDAGVDLFGPLVALWRGQTLPPELQFRPTVVSPVFPFALLAVPCWRSGAALRALGSRPVREPKLMAHIAHRLMRASRTML
ncbi:MAG TPA: ATP-grasp domain-containing protein [Kofleriaceae bacterium]|nr:ATP-grasp domain-containing protein [Kofleriaceae bacterium]